MSVSQVALFMKATRRIIREIRPYRGDEELMSKVTRTVIFSTYMWLRDICPEETLEDTRDVDRIYEDLMHTIHIRFYTHQIGSVYDQPV